MRKYLYHFVFCPYYLNMRSSYSKAISYFSVDYQLKRAQLFKNIILRIPRGSSHRSKIKIYAASCGHLDLISKNVRYWLKQTNHERDCRQREVRSCFFYPAFSPSEVLTGVQEGKFFMSGLHIPPG